MLVKEFQNPTSIGKTEPEKRPVRSTQPGGMGGMGGMTQEKMKEMLAKMPPQMREAFEKMSPEERRSMMRQMGGRRRGPARAAKPKLTALAEAHRIRQSLLESTQVELRSVVNAFSGGYLTASPGGDPVSNPATVPTGRNLYGIDPERTPTRESYAVGKKLGEALIAAKLKKTGKYPKKSRVHPLGRRIHPRTGHQHRGNLLPARRGTRLGFPRTGAGRPSDPGFRAETSPH